MKRRDFNFESGGERLVGDLFLPASSPHAALVTTGPLTSVKEQASGAYARALADRGFVTLAFDHRYFGQSGGRPRQFENPVAKIEDLSNAISALLIDDNARGLPVAGVGICMGGGYMAAAVAKDPRFLAFAGVAGVYADAAATRESMGGSYETALARARAAEEAWLRTGVAETIPAVAPQGGDVGMPLREAYEFYGTARGAVPNYVNGFAVQSRTYTLEFDAQNAASKIKVPAIVVHSETALAPEWAHKFYSEISASKEELWLTSQGQIDFYDDSSLIGRAADAIARFFRRAF